MKRFKRKITESRKSIQGVLLTAVLLTAAGGGMLSWWGSSPTDTPVSESEPTPTSAPMDEQSESGYLQPAALAKWCSELKSEISKFKWDVEPCEGIKWKSAGKSVEGRELVYGEFGNPKATNRTLILSMVHPDEITPLYLGLELANLLKKNQKELANARVVIAPLVNPDGFYRKPLKRVNARGVDLNRNFSTRDWNERALAAWKKRYKSNPRRYPGSAPESEPETLFQKELINLVKPQKILSIHSPLNQFDYDGPMSLSLERFPKEYVNECLRLRRELKAVHSGFFPGSLGNYAGNELGIPTLTLELPSSDPARARAFWKRFNAGIRTMIDFEVPEYASRSDRSREERSLQ